VRVWVSGGSGFVGSHLVGVSDEVLAPSHAEVDVTDADAVRRSVEAYAPDAIVHASILNDFGRLERDGWAAYVGDAAGLIARIVAGRHAGVFHCCGGEAVDRRTLALRTVDAFGLDGDLLAFGPPPPSPFPIPYDTSLDATATAAALGVELPDLDTQLRQLERSLECLT
jgi:dTDP-4-dehydrorhamnose reductase